MFKLYKCSVPLTFPEVGVPPQAVQVWNTPPSVLGKNMAFQKTPAYNLNKRDTRELKISGAKSAWEFEVLIIGMQ
jgi:hypothetical protein